MYVQCKRAIDRIFEQEHPLDVKRNHKLCWRCVPFIYKNDDVSIFVLEIHVGIPNGRKVARPGNTGFKEILAG